MNGKKMNRKAKRQQTLANKLCHVALTFTSSCVGLSMLASSCVPLSRLMCCSRRNARYAVLVWRVSGRITIEVFELTGQANILEFGAGTGRLAADILRHLAAQGNCSQLPNLRTLSDTASATTL